MFKELSEKYYPEIKAIREDVHRHPELSFKEERTANLIMDKLREYGVDSVERCWDTGVVAVIKGSKGEGKCIAIRADTDALPVGEETGVEFASENPGVMHACGHDIHVANLLCVARLLCDKRDEFPGCVKLIFQPAEESANPSNPKGGALPMIEHGCMENPHVDAIIAIHNMPSNDKPGVFGLKKGVVTSGFDLYRFDVHGTAAHGSQPHTGHDAVLAMSQLVVLLQQVVSRNIDPLKTGILTVGTISGGTAINIIPAECTSGGVFRYYDNDTAKVIKENTLNIARGVESVSGCKIDVHALSGYACVDNDSDLIDICDAALTKELGEDMIYHMDAPASGSEDFSAYNLYAGVPCALMWVNAAPYPGTKLSVLHAKDNCVSSDMIKDCSSGLARIAVEYLNK